MTGKLEAGEIPAIDQGLMHDSIAGKADLDCANVSPIAVLVQNRSFAQDILANQDEQSTTFKRSRFVPMNRSRRSSPKNCSLDEKCGH